jgi:4-hydroxy-tetrahydrodipicolinate reductase
LALLRFLKIFILRIALVGYGKMGKAIETIAVANNHTISFKIDENNKATIADINNSNTDVAIEFTSPHSALHNVLQLLNNKVPVVCGSTGWNEDLPKAKEAALQNETSFLWASNFSLGVQLFFAFNAYVAQKMNAFSAYEPSVHEVHHTAKLDAPSGTAITTAEYILQNYSLKNNWSKGITNDKQAIPITSERIDPAPGYHAVTYKGPYDEIVLSHNAISRDGFASGAVLAATFIYNKKGIFTMQEVLGL